jgi:DNA-binding response OmpR family regulator
MCGGNKPCILIVEDNKASREGLDLVLQDNGYCTLLAATAGEAIVILDDKCSRGEDCPDLMIIDIDLPDIFGGTLAKWTRQVYPHIPFIFLTAYGKLPAFIEIAEMLGAPLEVKPINVDELLPLLAATLRDFQARRQTGRARLEVPPVLRERIETVREARAATGGDVTG